MAQKIAKKDIVKIINHAKGIDKIATKYGMAGNLAQVYIEAYQQLRRENQGSYIWEDPTKIVKDKDGRKHLVLS